MPFAGTTDQQGSTGEVKRLVIQGVILSAITLSALAVGLYFLYDASYQRQARHLQDAVTNKGAFIDSVARFDRQNQPAESGFAGGPGEGPSAAILHQIDEAFARSPGLGRTGEFVLGARQGDEVVVLSHQRKLESASRTHRYPLEDDRAVAEPLRAAFKGESGIVRGNDFQGQPVLAAVHPLPGLDWALVAKKDLAEIRAPFIRAGGIAGLGALLLIGFGGLGFRRALAPVIRGLRASRSHYNRLIQLAGEGILYMDAEDRIRIANGRVREILALPEEVEGRELLSVLPEEVHAPIREKLRGQRFTEGTEFEISAIFGGQQRHLAVTATPCFDDRGGYEGSLALVIDQTDTREMQQSLVDERKLLHSVLEALPVGIWATDAEGQCRFSNSAFEKIWKGDPYANLEHACQQHRAWWPETGEPVQPQEWAVWRVLKESREVHNEVLDIECFDGSHRTVLNSALPLSGGDGAMDGAIIVNDDITYRRQVERLMRRNEQLLERVLENLPEGVAITDDRGQYIMTNDSDARIWGFDRVDNRAHEVPGFAHREGGQGEVDEGDWPVDRVLSSAEPVQGDILEVIRRSDGDRRWLSCSAAPVFSSDQNLWGVVELVHDVTAERQQQAERRKLANAVDHAADAIFVLDALCCLEFCNPAFRAITGYSLDDVLGKRPEEFLNHGPDVVTGCQRMQQLASEGENGREVITVRDSKDRLRQWDCTVSPIFDDDNRTVNYLVSATDLSEDDRIRKELYRATRYDALTGLSNRAQMQEQLEQALAGSGYRPHVTGLVKMDIVGFSMINEKHGMDLGDQILRELACRLHGATREGDVLARTSGDSFKVLLTDVASEDDVPLVVEKLLAVFDENMVIDGEEVPCKVNTGVAVAPTDGTDAETLVRHVNVALARARQEEARVRFYAEQQGYLARRQLSLEVALREAIDQEQFELYFQPQINLQSGGMRGLETLLRWEHPDLGTISPGEFIPLAERTGLIAQLRPWVLRQALLQRAAWRAAGFDPGRVAVNLSARDFGDPTLPERVRGILEQTGETAEGLELEITETMLMERGDAQLNTLKELSNMGITISVDDFGTGYSSLAYLSVLPISLLKIDRSFINSVHYQTDTNASIIRSIVSMAQSLGLDVVAEGVETRWQLDFLKQLRCEVAQGFFLARPAPAWQIEEGLDKSTWLTA